MAKKKFERAALVIDGKWSGGTFHDVAEAKAAIATAKAGGLANYRDLRGAEIVPKSKAIAMHAATVKAAEEKGA